MHEFKTADGKAVSVTVQDRRRYGSGRNMKMMTWVDIAVEGVDTEFFGDPWPVARPARAAMLWLCRAQGYDIKPDAQAIRWGKKMLKERRIFVLSPNDAETYFELA